MVSLREFIFEIPLPKLPLILTCMQSVKIDLKKHLKTPIIFDNFWLYKFIAICKIF